MVERKKIGLMDDGIASEGITGMPRIFVQDTEPSDEESEVGDIWIDTDDTTLEDMINDYLSSTP